MAKVHPHPTANTCSDPSSSERETFTIWMKSLVCHGNGCTVFNSKGDVVFRVDNYQRRCSNKAYLMDSTGNILFSLNRKEEVATRRKDERRKLVPSSVISFKNLGFSGSWEGFKWIDSDVRMEKPWFRMRRNRPILSKDSRCLVSLGCDENCYTISGFEGKSTLRITDFSGQILAEATEKESSGVRFGNDVLRLVVESHVDKSLVMALVIVYALINSKL